MSQDRKVTLWVGLATSILGLATTVPPVLGPASDAPSKQLSEFIVSQRVAYLGSAYLVGLVWNLGMIVFFALLREQLSSADDPKSKRAALALGWGGVVSLGAMLASVGAGLMVAGHVIDRVGADAQLLLALGVQELTNFTAFPTVLTLLGFGLVLRTAGTSGRVASMFAVLVGACHLLSASNFSLTGALRPAGAFAQAAPILFSLWIGVAALASRGIDKAKQA